MIHRLSGSPKPLDLKFIPYDEISKGRKYEDVRRRIPDTTKAAQKLGFRAKVELEEGLKITIDWQRRIRASQLDMAVTR
jgi:UDP-glucose 4-epimerase